MSKRQSTVGVPGAISAIKGRRVKRGRVCFCILADICADIHTEFSVCVCVCVCVFFPFILDIKFVGRTSRGHTGVFIHLLSAVRALLVLARRVQPFLSLVDREVEFLCANDFIVLLYSILLFLHHF